MTKLSGRDMDRMGVRMRRALRANGGRALRALMALLLPIVASACASVRPEQRAILADPTMRHEDEDLEAEARQHVLENREGAFGGSSVRGGGCGCN